MGILRGPVTEAQLLMISPSYTMTLEPPSRLPAFTAPYSSMMSATSCIVAPRVLDRAAVEHEQENAPVGALADGGARVDAAAEVFGLHLAVDDERAKPVMRAEAHRVGESLRKSLVRRHGADVEDVVGVKADDALYRFALARGVEQRSAGDHEPCGTPPFPRPFSSLKPPAFVPATPPYLATSSVSCKAGGLRVEFLTRNAENDARRVAHDERLALGCAVCDGDELHAVVRRFRPTLRGGGRCG